jgi:hypothetical protein
MAKTVRLEHGLYVRWRFGNHPQMSDVAVWRSSAFLVSLNSRAFSIAITASSAKVCSS